MNISKKVVFSIILLLISQTIFADSRFGVNRAASKKSQRSSSHSTHKQKSTFKARSTKRASSFNPPSRSHYDSPRHSYKTKRTRQTPSFNPPGRRHNYYRPGYNTRYLPYGSRRMFFNDLEYFFFDGYFYRPYRNEYHIVDGPIGAIVLSLPRLHFSLHWDGMDYFHAGNTYYRRHPRGYVVIRNPGFNRDRWR